MGALIAERLGYTLINEQIVEEIALEANVSPQWVNQVSNEAGGGGWLAKIMYKLGPFRNGYQAVAMEDKPGYIDGNLYISLLHKVIPKIAENDNVVILGRGGQYILADYPNTYHLFMVADLSQRVQFMMDHYNMTQKQAQIVVDKQSKRRLNLFRYFGREDYDSPKLYHLVLNMSKLSMEDATRAVAGLVAAPPPSE